jgi:hypothetical protein
LKEKKILLTNIFVLIIFLFSGVSAGLVVNTGNVKDPVVDGEKTQNSDFFVEPDIKLTSFHLPFLKSSISRIKDDDVKQVVSKIIEHIQMEGVVDSEDLKNFVEKLGLSESLRGIHSGLVTGSCPCCKSLIVFPGLLRQFILCLTNLGFPSYIRLFGYSTFVYWESMKKSYHGCSIEINNVHNYPKGHQGFIIGFLGKTAQGPKDTTPLPSKYIFEIAGLGALIIIT